jgi:uncharacterized protein (DUF1800 family)
LILSFDPTLAAFRFGYGLSPHHSAPQDVQTLMADLSGPDLGQKAHHISVFSQAAPTPLALNVANREQNRARGTDKFEAAQAHARHLMKLAREQAAKNLGAEIARAVDAPVGFRERLVAFWADHFTVRSRSNRTTHLVTPYIEEAIRPHITGNFADLLFAATTHPMMMNYLQQTQSIGPNSVIGLRRGRGLNENLAREVMELHTLGVDGPYTQTDVTEFAELLSGLSYTPLDGFEYSPRRAEPGRETVLGVTYSDEASLDTIRDALDDLARHPATAAHLAHKIAVHFLSQTPNPSLVADLTEAFAKGRLMDVYQTLLDHPAAWVSQREKVRTPQEYITASLRALGISGQDIAQADRTMIRRYVVNPMRVMGQPWQRPVGPDGWPEDPAAWIIPQTMAGRITWAMRTPQDLLDVLPDPRDFVRTALGPRAAPEVVFAAGAAASRKDGVGVVLSSAAFQRR